MTWLRVLLICCCAASILPAQKDDGAVYDLGPGITPPRVIKQVNPTYPTNRGVRAVGSVIIALVVSSKGLPKDPHVVKGLDKDLDESAVEAVKGDTSKKDAMKAAMEKADFKSLRGPFKYGNNHIPIQNFYLQDVVKDADGGLSLKTVATIVKDDQDRFHDKCPMK